jgi:hypothetical protein
MLFPMLTAEYGCILYCTSLQISLYFCFGNIYLIDIKSETLLTLFWEYINGKLFAVQSLYM